MKNVESKSLEMTETFVIVKQETEDEKFSPLGPNFPEGEKFIPLIPSEEFDESGPSASTNDHDYPLLSNSVQFAFLKQPSAAKLQVMRINLGAVSKEFLAVADELIPALHEIVVRKATLSQVLADLNLNPACVP